MTEHNSESEFRPELSPTERLEIIRYLNQLPETQFEELIYALSPPPGVVPGKSAPQGNRSSSLLEWVEGPTGPSLTTLKGFIKSPKLQPTIFGNGKTKSPISSIFAEYLIPSNQTPQKLNRYKRKLKRYIKQSPNSDDIDDAEDLIWRIEQLQEILEANKILREAGAQSSHSSKLYFVRFILTLISLVLFWTVSGLLLLHYSQQHKHPFPKTIKEPKTELSP